MSNENTSRQPSFVMISEMGEEMATTSGLGSRLPASSLDIDNDVTNKSLIDLTPSGEIKMRVKNTRNMSTTFSDSDNTSLNVHDLRQELIEHREAERRIMGLLGGHSDDGGRPSNKRISYEEGDSLLIDNRREYLRGQGDQCYGPSTNSSWKEPPNMRGGGGFGTVRMDQNGCVGTTTPQERMNTNYNVGQGRNNIENSHSMMFPNNNYPNRNQISLQTNTHIKDKKPPNFEGTINWQDFLVQFEMVAAVNKWDDNAKAFELATSLRGVAQGVVTEIEPLRRFDYNYLV
ncbi:unnamed protein product [Mytilus edulis]|uniref:Uncharacterized protein n=1 Tax=Mytilus edulis TaxID=6550 RepID=A0A8S3QRS4_MYTED|nr:unnamed protein product [Mytilus edulis]